MKFFENVLEESIVEDLAIDVKQNFKKFNWVISTLTWQKELFLSSIGPVYVTEVDLNLQNKIENSICKYFPRYKSLQIYHYLWDKNSSISVHDDGERKFGATIYLNKNWDINHGGIFLYKTNEKWNANIPKFNSMTLNDEFGDHLVTIISPNATEFRHTLQIWGY